MSDLVCNKLKLKCQKFRNFLLICKMSTTALQNRRSFSSHITKKVDVLTTSERSLNGVFSYTIDIVIPLIYDPLLDTGFLSE